MVKFLSRALKGSRNFRKKPKLAKKLGTETLKNVEYMGTPAKKVLVLFCAPDTHRSILTFGCRCFWTSVDFFQFNLATFVYVSCALNSVKESKEILNRVLRRKIPLKHSTVRKIVVLQTNNDFLLSKKHG